MALQASKARLQTFLERGQKPSKLSVFDLRMCFSAEAQLLDVLREVVLGRGASMAGVAGGATGAGGPHLTGLPISVSLKVTTPTISTQEAADITNSSEPKQGGGEGARCEGERRQEPAGATTTTSSMAARSQLPGLDDAYVGRDEEAVSLVAQLMAPGTRGMLLLAGAGMGKSSLAVDVGQRLLGAGAVPGGALWADMREAGSAGEVDSRLCACLGVQQVSRFLQHSWDTHASSCSSSSRYVVVRGRHVPASIPL